MVKVLVFAGSARKDSVNKKLAALAAEQARQWGAEVTHLDLHDYPIPLYSGDLEVELGQPENAKYIREQVLKSDVVLIASPEYNSSLPPLLKNTLDWVSRDEKGQGSLTPFKGKRFGIMSASPGWRGGSRALEHLRSILSNIGAEVAGDQVTIPQAYEAFDDENNLIKVEQKEKLKAFVFQVLDSKKT